MDSDNQKISHARIDSIRLVNYKNYEKAAVGFSAGLNFFVGINGAGKTNLLDALHYLCITKGFVTPQDKYSLRFGSDFFRLEAMVSRGEKQHRITAKVSPGSLKEIAVDNVKVERLADHIGFLPVIVLTPSAQELIQGPSAGRRRFADFYLCQTDRSYLEDMLIYNRLLAQRNALLKERGRLADSQLLFTYTEKMQPHAHRIAAVRRGFIQQLKPLVTTVYGTVSEHADDVTIAYKADVGVDSLSTMARESLEKDRALGRTTRGIHRDDISFVMNEKAIRRYGSQGQMKTYLVALHLALRQYIETHTGITPVVLMDDIFGKLDDRRVMSLVSLLSAGAGRQVFITDARHQRIVAICNSLDVPARVIEIRDAAISSVQDYGNSNQKVNFGATPHHDQEE